MEMLAYIVLGAVLYGLLAERIDRTIERETRSRRKGPPDLRLVGDTDRHGLGRADIPGSSAIVPPT